MAVIVNILLVTIIVTISGYNAQEISFKPVIPEECKSQGYCTDVPNYPSEQVNIVIQQLKEQGKWEEVLPVKKFRRSVSNDPGNIELCNATTQEVLIKASVDNTGSWYYVLLDVGERWGFIVDLCHDKGSCNPLVKLQYGYSGMCEQKYIFKITQVLGYDGKPTWKSLRVPSNCHCSLETN